MKRRIQRSMGFILFITLIISSVLYAMMIYKQNLDLMENTVAKEAIYLQKAIDASSENYIQDIASYVGESRITLIDKTGTVLFDSKTGSETMENHGGREEVVNAFQTGEGETKRVSSTIGKYTHYHARLLGNGDVIRVSQTTDSVLDTIWSMLPSMLLIGLILWLIAMSVARLETIRMIEPINQLDVDHPRKNKVYEELTPLLIRMEQNNQERDKNANMRKEFSANVSHELRTPLTSISGYAELMKNGLVRNADMSRFSGIIYDEANRLIGLVEDIIKISKLDEGTVELEKEEVDLYQMIQEINKRLFLQAEAKNIKVTIQGTSTKYTGVKRVLDEMIYNILENAIKYNVQGGTVDVQLESTNAQIILAIEDSGIGIPEGLNDRVFERFYRVDKSHSKETGGTGLGLSIVKHGAILHNAEVTLKSELGRGTKVTIKMNTEKE